MAVYQLIPSTLKSAGLYHMDTICWQMQGNKQIITYLTGCSYNQLKDSSYRFHKSSWEYLGEFPLVISLRSSIFSFDIFSSAYWKNRHCFLSLKAEHAKNFLCFPGLSPSWSYLINNSAGPRENNQQACQVGYTEVNMSVCFGMVNILYQE